MELVFLWGVWALIVAIMAPSRGRSGVGWFVLAVLISPLLANILLFGLPSRATPAPIAPVTPAPAPDTVFRADGMVDGKPYSVGADGRVRLLDSGREIEFASVAAFESATGARLGGTMSGPAAP